MTVRRPTAMYRDKAAVKRAGTAATGRVAIAHVRWASNPLKLKHSELIGKEHTQPFSHQKWLFAHNGTLFIPKEVAAHLGPWKRYIRGKNDSEVLFYWILKHVGHAQSVTQARSMVKKALKGLQIIWNTCKKSYPLHRYPYHGLNWVLTNGKTLFSLCLADPSGFGKSKALCNRKQCYYQLQRKISESQAIIASEPLDHSGLWTSFKHGELLMAKLDTRGLQIQTVNVL